jgi:hypothetical protein
MLLCRRLRRCVCVCVCVCVFVCVFVCSYILSLSLLLPLLFLSLSLCHFPLPSLFVSLLLPLPPLSGGGDLEYAGLQ